MMTLPELRPHDFGYILDQHVRSLFLCDQAALRGVRRGHPTPHGYILLASYTDEVWGLVTSAGMYVEAL